MSKISKEHNPLKSFKYRVCDTNQNPVNATRTAQDPDPASFRDYHGHVTRHKHFVCDPRLRGWRAVDFWASVSNKTPFGLESIQF